MRATDRRRRGVTVMELAQRVWRRARRHRILDQSARLSFYFFLAVFPLLLLCTALVGPLLRSGPELRETLRRSLSNVLPPSALGVVDTALSEIAHTSWGISLVIALVLALWSAAQGMGALMEGLNVAYEAPTRRPTWNRYVVATAFTLALLATGAAVLALMIYGRPIAERLAAAVGLEAWSSSVWWIFQRVVLLGFAVLVFGAVYAYAPNLKARRWRWMTAGIASGVVLWLLASFGLRAYLLAFRGYTLTYGSIGAVIMLQLWFWLSGIAVLLGAEVDSEVESARHVRP
jgi:membrane protein